MQHSNAEVPTDQSKYSQYRAILVCDHNGAGARNAITGWEDFILKKEEEEEEDDDDDDDEGGMDGDGYDYNDDDALLPHAHLSL